jgi:hypothetical protein
MKFKGFFIDDTVEEGIFAAMLSTSGPDGLSIEYKEVSEAASLAEEIFVATPDIVALDFRLDGNPGMIDPKMAYQGSGLAQLLRDKATVDPQRDFPIVLISAEDKFEQYYRPDATAHDLFDRTYGKVAAEENKVNVRAELVSLCAGYRTLKSVWVEGADRFSIFGLDGDERHLVETQELRNSLGKAAAPHIAARVILRDVIDRTGVLLSDREVAARLGLDSIGALDKVLEENGLRYLGVFNEGWRRWWTHRFDVWAEALFGKRPANMLGSERAAAVEAKFGLGIKGAVSTWNSSPDERFAFACAACLRPGEVRHSVSVFDPNAPRFTQRRRICWDCIQTDMYKQFRLVVDDVDANIAADVLKKDREHNEAA